MSYDAPELVEPTYPLPAPTPDADGVLSVSAPVSPKEITTRPSVPVPPPDAMPVIVVPGIMGTNLRATSDPAKPKNGELKPGEAAWQPPNGQIDKAKIWTRWRGKTAKQRQKIFDAPTLEVDDRGEIDLGVNPNNYVIDSKIARQRGWGKVHWDSYGKLLVHLQQDLNKPFVPSQGKTVPAPNWVSANYVDRAHWGCTKQDEMAPLEREDLAALARFNHPVYAFGYNWLESCENAALALKEFIAAVRAEWDRPNHPCRPVVLVTHSMGGLVARACAKMAPESIAGVVHAVMPAIGAPAAYRRIACGVEGDAPGIHPIDNSIRGCFAEIVGRSTDLTTPVMAVAPGPLELLPNHLYPGPWLFAAIKREDGERSQLLRLPTGNPYDLYGDTKAWYRMIDLALVDPAKKFGSVQEIEKSLTRAIDQAERFHTKVLGDYYHPNTYVFYGADKAGLSFGSCTWIAEHAGDAVSSKLVANGRLRGRPVPDVREVELEGGKTLRFRHAHQDVNGDGTVPEQSGAAPQGKVKRIFRTKGYEHQECFNQREMLFLTLHLVARIIQKVQ
ncbi:esterase/lipase family protein [Massilia horti]|uniref:GPI inositol-deacylase PGAP1-like alpha/beta domain-containing protein n=1 Tax=Massilia horti TaxID=2562153 RepID=A0A4Y9T1K6_9BURK|nr:alpha/beta hydrolase [Massilia horti]TFW31774.1 hypothetical protein E4O92_12565 [Massilia horti]